MSITKSFRIAFCAMLLWGVADLAWAIPPNMTVTGRLLDKNGNPIHYYTYDPIWGKSEYSVILHSRIQFYDSKTAASPFAALATSTTCNLGYFQMGLRPPISVITKDSVWYAVSIDVDQNGLTSSDDFPDRVEMGSVPYALSAKPQNSFTTCFGVVTYRPFDDQTGGSMMVVPFETPPGGIEFNQMNTIFQSVVENTSLSFGIYDEQGKRVAYSGVIHSPATVSLAGVYLQVAHPTVKLEPSKIYYVGLTQYENTFGSMMAACGVCPAAPTFGTVTIPKSSGGLPTSFNPDNIDSDPYAVALPVTLINTDKATTTGFQKTSLGGTSYRWIQSKVKTGK